MVAQEQTRSKRSTDARVDEAAERVRELNERIIDSSRRTGLAFLDTYEKGLYSVADFQDKLGDTSQIDWVSAVAHAQAQVTRNLADAYTSAARGVFERK
jgi:hypothetical protein